MGVSDRQRWALRLAGVLATGAMLTAALGPTDAPPATAPVPAITEQSWATTSTRHAVTTTSRPVRPTTSAGTTSTSAATTSTLAPAPPPGEPAEVTRDIPPAAPAEPPPAAPPPPWAGSVTTTGAGYISTGVGCAGGTGAGSIDAFFAQRVGPLLGADYQHVVALGGNRYAWFFQDAFIDPGGSATRLDQAHFAHNVALIQDGNCFSLLHRGTAAAPKAFEPGNGDDPLKKWFWPMGGETFNGVLTMFWVEMVKDNYTPGPGDGLGWHPIRTWMGTYDARTLKRRSFAPAPNSSANPIYGYAVASDATHTYLFGNTFEQNLVREGGFFGGQHSATAMYLARVPLGQFGAAMEYRTAEGWSANAAEARPFVQRYWTENPMQPRYLSGQWVSVAKVDGYWGDRLVVEVANQPWGPWTTTEFRGIAPRGGDPAMNTYHAHLLPWRNGSGSLVVTISQNARLMNRDAFPHPHRYRIAAFASGWVAPPPDPVPTTTTTSTTSTSSTSTSSTSSTTSTTVDPTSTSSNTSTSTSTTSTTTSSTSSTTTSTSAPP